MQAGLPLLPWVAYCFKASSEPLPKPRTPALAQPQMMGSASHSQPGFPRPLLCSRPMLGIRALGGREGREPEDTQHRGHRCRSKGCTATAKWSREQGALRYCVKPRTVGERLLVWGISKGCREAMMRHDA